MHVPHVGDVWIPGWNRHGMCFAYVSFGGWNRCDKELVGLQEAAFVCSGVVLVDGLPILRLRLDHCQSVRFVPVPFS
jgi:hypothetical protein